MKKVRRYDSGSITRMEKTADGFIKGTARVTRTGVFTYRNADGTLRRELRHPDEVFSKSSMDSMKMIPVTNLHPTDKLVTVDTAKSLAIGFTGENVIPDGKFVMIPIAITSADGVKAVENGREELSLGYEVELDEMPGSYDGQEYDHVQRNIRYNHLAIVDKGRAGADVRLNMDVDDAIEHINNKPNTRSDSMPKIRLDNGCEYEVPQEVVSGYTALQTRADTAEKKVADVQKNLDTVTGERDTARDTVKQLQTKVDGLPSAIADGVKARTDLVKVANDSLDEETLKKLDSMSNEEIKKAVIIAKFPEAKLDGKSAEYVQARFDAACEVKTDTDEDSIAKQREKAIGKRADSHDDGCSEKKRKDMAQRLTDAYKAGNVNQSK